MALVLLLFFGLMVPSTAPVAKPELIILSLIDDLGFADIRPNGPWSPTPHIGALAAQGVQLRHLHAYKVLLAEPAEPAQRPVSRAHQRPAGSTLLKLPAAPTDAAVAKAQARRLQHALYRQGPLGLSDY
jgi:hypothetical protein